MDVTQLDKDFQFIDGVLREGLSAAHGAGRITAEGVGETMNAWARIMQGVGKLIEAQNESGNSNRDGAEAPGGSENAD